MTIERRIFEQWYIKTAEEFPFWKQIVWRVFGKKLVGSDNGCTVTMHTLKGITYVSKIELDNEK